ncbi:hypothetical protein H0H81_008321 [Sphagnurus paluster]|uniref:PNPLA domain-containing protein n=1 Tax=Sphagnurus paluster TaxID=117069 RepID=A0A9P7GW84_9AGAR|nr:hypothetical protein H0H81_008321 [Sphagnurus paluster]
MAKFTPSYIASATEPVDIRALDEDMVEKVVEIQLQTLSRDQGWADDESGSWSWFEVIVLDSPEASEPKFKDGLSLVWLSHYNNIADEEFTYRFGEVFSGDHDIFNGLEVGLTRASDATRIDMDSQVGNALAVRVCARFNKWENYASEGNFILKLSENRRNVRKSRPSPAPEESKYWEAIAEQVTTLSEEFHDMLDRMTPAGAPPAYSPLKDFVPTEPLTVCPGDGGGVRGISSLYILKEIMAKVSPNNPNLKPCQYFDLIVGTSTGGLIAIMLGRLQMTISECIQAYEALSSSIFSGNIIQRTFNKTRTGYWYTADKFEKDVKALIKKKTGDENALMRDPDPNNKCKVFVVSIDSQDIINIHHIRTYASIAGDPFPDCKIWEAARATAAGPMYLPPIKINNIELVDGGFGKNNPISLYVRIKIAHICHSQSPLRLFAELCVLFGDPKFPGFGIARPIDCFLSIGTGMQPLIKIEHVRATGPVESIEYHVSLAKAAAALATNTEDGHIFGQKIFSQREGVYFRFNAGVKKGKDWEKLIDLDNWAGMPELVEITKRYLLGEAKRVEECASKIN